MTRSRPITFLAGAAAVPIVALAVTGCGGGASASTRTTGASSPTPAPSTKTVASARSAAVHVANSRLGKILVDSHGRTLYLFKKDKGKKSACFGSCAQFWPPLRAAGKPKAGSGAKASLLGTIKRSDGAAQVTYNGHPLYLFVMDKKAGDTNGEGVTAFGGTWFAVSPTGKQISRPAAKQAAGGSTAPASKPPTPAPAPAQPAPHVTPKPAPKPASPPKPSPPSSSNGIPQNGGGDGDADNNGGPSDGDGNL
jgi:predicted lipoprotein with Yx(FWY)xxD motif